MKVSRAEVPDMPDRIVAATGSLFTIAGLQIDAEKLLGVTVSVSVSVSVLTPNGLPPKFRSDVLKDAQPL